MRNQLFFGASLLSLVVACSSGSGPVPSTSGGGGNALEGVATAEAPAPPSGSKVTALWQVTSGSPDYLYAQTAGTAAGGDKTSFALSTTPPVEALNAGKLGIAFVTVFDPGATPADGKVTGKGADAALAISADYAIIYRATTDTVLKNGWDAKFPQGFSCGKCQHAETGFDSYVVVDCSEVRLVPMSTKPKICNWT